MIMDLSHVLEAGMPSYPGLPAPKLGTFLSHREAPRHAHYAPGVSFEIAVYEFGGNTGTYVDAPFHRWPDGADFSKLPLERLANLAGVLIEAPEAGEITSDIFAAAEVNRRAVVFHTGWSQRWGRPDYFRSGPYVGAGACEELIARGAALVGIDCANIDNMEDGARPAHSMLLRAGIPIVEHLCNLDRLRGREFRFFAAPPAVRGGTSFPVRAFAVCE
jgi:arylformamidase